MKGCIVLQNQFTKLGHTLAYTLKKMHGVDRWITYVISPYALDFARNQTDILYEGILADHELHEKYKEETVDPEFLERFERTYTGTHGWHYLYSDRKLMMSIGPKEETTTTVDPLYSHEDLLRILQARARAIEYFFDTHKPDFIFFFSIGTLSHILLFHIAKQRGIKTLSLDFPRFSNALTISEDYRTLTGVIEWFLKFRNGSHDTEHHTEARNLVDTFRKTGSLKLHYFELFKANYFKAERLLSLRKLYRSFSFLITQTKNYLANRGIFTYGNTNQHPLSFLMHRFKYRYRIWRGISDLTSTPRNGEKYAYYPLHYEPELATLLLSPFYYEQLMLIKLIARSLPLEFTLYVKEHPAMYGRRARSFYKDLLKIPNVRIFDAKASGFEAIKNARIITTITGTAGWEACLLGKPVITFGEVFYNELSFVKRVHNIETLPGLIRKQLDEFAYNETEMLDMVAATLKDSIGFDLGQLWYETDTERLKANDQVRSLASYIGSKLAASGIS